MLPDLAKAQRTVRVARSRRAAEARDASPASRPCPSVPTLPLPSLSARLLLLLEALDANRRAERGLDVARRERLIAGRLSLGCIWASLLSPFETKIPKFPFFVLPAVFTDLLKTGVSTNDQTKTKTRREKKKEGRPQ